MVKKEKKEASCCEKVITCIVLVGLGGALLFGLFVIFMISGQEKIDISLNQEVADEICMQLTGENFAVASDDYNENGYGHGGSLICDVFSEGSTKGIIINR